MRDGGNEAAGNTAAGRRVLQAMLDRLYASILSGPALNCRPHHSRQRLDLTDLEALRDRSTAEVVRDLLATGRAKLTARVDPPPQDDAPRPDPAEAPEHASPADGPAAEAEGAGGPASADAAADAERASRRAAREAWLAQQAVLRKLRLIADEAKTYEEDTGVYALSLGLPLLDVPRGGSGGGGGVGQRRVLAPLALVPVTLRVSAGARPTVELICRYAGAERLVPSEALLAWVEQQTGTPVIEPDAQETADDPLGELAELARTVCGLMEIEVPAWLPAPAPHGAKPAAPAEPPHGATDPEGAHGAPEADAASEPDAAATPEALADAPPIPIVRAPAGDARSTAPALVPAAVLGLFPVSNQGLLRDTKAMLADGPPEGPVRSFLTNAALEAAEPAGPDTHRPPEPSRRVYAEERFIRPADPFQARAVRAARTARGLVIHGPPGTGKSQTIANIIGDCLSRGERVLFVCEKRTALDVVANRLRHDGLGDLLALVHDAQRDRAPLYMAVREQLEQLPDRKPPARADAALRKTDAELQALHDELTELHDALSGPAAQAEDRLLGHASFGELVGRWLGFEPPPGVGVPPDVAAALDPREIERHRLAIEDTLARALEIDFPSNPWKDAAGIPLARFVARPGNEVREALWRCTRAAAEADAAITPHMPPFAPAGPMRASADAFAALAPRLRRAAERATPELRRRLAALSPEAAAEAARRLRAAEASAAALRAATPDPELELVLRDRPPAPAAIAADLATLAKYRHAASAWWGFLAFRSRSAAGRVLAAFGLPATPENAERVHGFLTGVRHAMTLRAALEAAGRPPASDLPEPRPLLDAYEAHRAVLDLLEAAAEEAARPAADAVRSALAHDGSSDGPDPAQLAAALEAAPARAAAAEAVLERCASSGLFAPPWLSGLEAALRAHRAVGEDLAQLEAAAGTLEDVLRVNAAFEDLPRDAAVALRALVDARADAETGLATLARAVAEAEIGRRLAESASLQRLDPRRVETALARLASLQHAKHALVRDAILARWIQLQRDRLLAGTGSRLNTLGADLRRRLVTRGQRALRLRQAIALGRRTEGGDPLFDLRPVWMASPETVAQAFPLEPVFDVLIVDEASQCRLEEAVPVLARARRVVIAGDPKQLPPTRFFETAVTTTEAGEPETDQDLFESQQAAAEDLLGAALSIEIEQAYLDVHYRSRNADLIAFSNEHFYGSRLQAIPGHPRNRSRLAPLTLHRADGVYDKSANPIEAERVVAIVKDLLKRADPPSIGVACFNVVQRDLISERLDAAADEDPAFARRLAAARDRRGAGAFEGLFVKNLENVQGDERDHIIISTTYGPNPEGRFYRRFGPLGMPGGGRRLNVLVTRAREEVHLVTSIPPEAYRALPPLEHGQNPTGAYLLLAYLRFAEVLADLYEAATERRRLAESAPDSPEARPPLRRRETSAPTPLAESAAERLARDHALGGQLYWGNDGFCIDLALDHPDRAGDVTLGVLTDFHRFAGASDPIEWELFRTLALASQGWTLHRVWSPQLFRDSEVVLAAIADRAAAEAATAVDPDALPTWSEPPAPAPDAGGQEPAPDEG